jgi:hypothetical protein
MAFGGADCHRPAGDEADVDDDATVEPQGGGVVSGEKAA